jgi:hypothetical protein
MERHGEKRRMQGLKTARGEGRKEEGNPNLAPWASLLSTPAMDFLQGREKLGERLCTIHLE